MAEQISRFKDAENVPAFATVAVLAGQFVKIVGTKTSQGDYSIGPCAAGDRAFGVAEQDSGPTTQPSSSVERRINVSRAPNIARVKVGADIDASAGAVAVKSDANGAAIPQGGTGTIVGYALHSALVGSGGNYVEVAILVG